MKRTMTMFLAMLFLIGGLMTGKAQAFSLLPGGNKFLIDGQSFLTAEEDKLWGIFSISDIKPWTPLDNSNVAGPVDDPYWQSKDNGQHLSIRFGGLQFDGANWVTDSSFAELWLTNFSVFSATNSTNSDFMAGPGDGTRDPDTGFGKNMATGTLLAEFTFDQFAGGPSSVNPDLISAFGYLSVIGGSLQDRFDSDYFLGLYDVVISGNNVAVENPNENFGWNYTSSEYSAGAYIVPEPGTMMLLGFGLLGLAGFTKMRRRTEG